MSGLPHEEKLQRLIDALATNRAVAFVGSGASAPAGLPLWRDFLRDLLAATNKNDKSWERTKRFIDEGEFLLAAEMLQRQIPPHVFRDHISSTFSRDGLTPSDIHFAIARLPFKILITTNFDCLLEAAYRDRQAVFDWTEPQEILEQIRSGQRRTIIKMHGTVDKLDSLRLTRTHYRDHAHKNPAFNECLKTLLLSNTFLFIGYSLRDSDLLKLIDEARILFEHRFGPHFAVMPSAEADSPFAEYLEEALSIHVIPYGANPYEDEPKKTREVVRILRELAGGVALRRHERTRLLGFSDVSFNRRTACQTLLTAAVELTGSFRGDICFIKDETNRALARTATVPTLAADHLPEPTMTTVIGATFLQPNNEGECTYLPDVSSRSIAQARLNELGYTAAEYATCHPDVLSEVACPIISDGERVGVLNLESNLADAYTAEHLALVQRLAAQAGWIYYEAEQREGITRRLETFYQEPSKFQKVMSICRLLRQFSLKFVLYDIDYEQGKLWAWGRPEGRDGDKFHFSFDQRSLANETFKARRGIVINDIALEMKSDNPRLSERGLKEFCVGNRVFACPVRSGGQTAAILATWPAVHQENPAFRHPSAFQAVCERVYRMSNLLANDIGDTGVLRAAQLFTYIDNGLQTIDGGSLWDSSSSRIGSFERAY